MSPPSRIPIEPEPNRLDTFEERGCGVVGRPDEAHASWDTWSHLTAACFASAVLLCNQTTKLMSHAQFANSSLIQSDHDPKLSIQ